MSSQAYYNQGYGQPQYPPQSYGGAPVYQQGPPVSLLLLSPPTTFSHRDVPLCCTFDRAISQAQ